MSATSTGGNSNKNCRGRPYRRVAGQSHAPYGRRMLARRNREGGNTHTAGRLAPGQIVEPTVPLRIGGAFEASACLGLQNRNKVNRLDVGLVLAAFAVG